MRNFRNRGCKIHKTEAKKYAGKDRNELDMVIQFEHVSLGEGKYGKWSTDPVNLKELKAVWKKWEEGLEGEPWIASIATTERSMRNGRWMIPDRFTISIVRPYEAVAYKISAPEEN